MLRPVAVVLVAAAIAGACSSGGATTSSTDGAANVTTGSSLGTVPTTSGGAGAEPGVPSTSSRSTSSPTSAPPSVPPTELTAEALCAGTPVVGGQVENPQLTEASGVVASRRYPGVLWSHNDGQALPGLFALGADGADLGVRPLPIDGVIDVEDIALQAGADNDLILLADIGDNRLQRATVRIYRFPEPDPAESGPLQDVEVLEFVYPDGAHNAEVLLVDDEAATIVIVTKEQRAVGSISRDLGPTEPSLVFEGPLGGHGDGPVPLELVGLIDAPELSGRTTAAVPHPSSIIGIGGVPTGGDVAADGSLVALRTYETAWVWPRRPGQSVAEAFDADPCQVPVAAELQGEALALDGDELVTMGEGNRVPVNRVAP